LKPDRTSAPEVADRGVDDAEDATQGDARPPEVSASAAPSRDAPSPLHTDQAIRTAAKLAIDAGDLARARVLLDLLDARPRAAAVLMLATRKPGR
jgi:hypothetical protein